MKKRSAYKTEVPGHYGLCYLPALKRACQEERVFKRRKAERGGDHVYNGIKRLIKHAPMERRDVGRSELECLFNERPQHKHQEALARVAHERGLRLHELFKRQDDRDDHAHAREKREEDVALGLRVLFVFKKPEGEP